MNYLLKTIGCALILVCFWARPLQAQPQREAIESAYTVLSYLYETTLQRTLLLQAYQYRNGYDDPTVYEPLEASFNTLIALSQSFAPLYTESPSFLETQEPDGRSLITIPPVRSMPYDRFIRLAPHGVSEANVVGVLILEQATLGLTMQLRQVLDALKASALDKRAKIEAITAIPSVRVISSAIVNDVTDGRVVLSDEQYSRPVQQVQAYIRAIDDTIAASHDGSSLEHLANMLQLLAAAYPASTNQAETDAAKLLHMQLFHLKKVIIRLQQTLQRDGHQLRTVPSYDALKNRLAAIATDSGFIKRYEELLQKSSADFLASITMKPADLGFDDAYSVLADAFGTLQGIPSLSSYLSVGDQTLPIAGVAAAQRVVLENAQLGLAAPELAMDHFQINTVMFKLGEIFDGLLIVNRLYAGAKGEHRAWLKSINTHALVPLILAAGDIMLDCPNSMPSFFTGARLVRHPRNDADLFFRIYFSLWRQQHSALEMQNMQSYLVSHMLVYMDHIKSDRGRLTLASAIQQLVAMQGAQGPAADMNVLTIKTPEQFDAAQNAAAYLLDEHLQGVPRMVATMPRTSYEIANAQKSLMPLVNGIQSLGR